MSIATGNSEPTLKDLKTYKATFTDAEYETFSRQIDQEIADLNLPENGLIIDLTGDTDSDTEEDDEMEPIYSTRKKRPSPDYDTATTSDSQPYIPVVQYFYFIFLFIFRTSPSKTRKTRWEAKKFFLTFARCTVAASIVMERLVSMSPLVAIVATESHKDGTPHLHIFIEFKKKLDFTSPQYFDHLAGPGYHCNISTIQHGHTHRVLRYVTKDQNFLLYGLTAKALEIILSGTSYTLGEVAADIASDPNLYRIALKYPTHFIHYSRGIRQLIAIHVDFLAKKTETFTYDPTYVAPFLMRELDSWFRQNFLSECSKPLRSVQLWIHGPTQTGKSRFLQFLCKCWNGYLLSPIEDYYDGYHDNEYAFLYMDEFRGKSMYFLNSLLGGERIIMPFKGGQYTKRQNKPVILCGNLSPRQVFSRISVDKPLVFQAFLTRICVINTQQFLFGSHSVLHAYVDDLEKMIDVIPKDE